MVSIPGGEPLMHPQIGEIIEGLVARKKYIYLCSNALLLKGDENAEISCAVAALHANAGVVQPDLLVIDSTAEVITGEGTVDFRQERYDLRLKGDSKRPSVLALRGPIVIGGTFKTPTVGPALGPLAARVGASVGWALAPPLAILLSIDLGDAADVDCRAVDEEARIRAARPNASSAGRKANRVLKPHARIRVRNATDHSNCHAWCSRARTTGLVCTFHPAADLHICLVRRSGQSEGGL
jgi:hypothetical protein